MSGIWDCLSEAVASGALSDKSFQEYRQRYEAHKESARQRGMGVAETERFAGSEAALDMERRNTGKRDQVRNLILHVDSAWEGAAKNNAGLKWGLVDVFGEHVRGEGSGRSLAQQQRGNYDVIQSIMADTMAKLQSGMFGLKRDRILPQHTVRALFGKDVVDPAAKQAAKAWTDAVDWTLDELQRQGVFVRRKDDWRLFQKWDAGRVKNDGRDAYVAQMQQWWNDKQLLLRDWEADGQAYMVPGLHDERATEIFERAYDNIVNPDANIEPGAMEHHSMADRYGRRRAFEWADDTAWMNFNEKYGVGSQYIGEAMLQYLDHLSRDLAMAQVLGPDPDRAAKILLQMAQKEGVPPKWVVRLQAMYDINSGKAMAPVDKNLALGMQAARNFLTSAQLGGTLLGSMADFAFTRSTASWYGLDMTRIMGDYIGHLKPSSPADRAEAMRRGLVNEVGLRGFHDAARDAFSDVTSRPGVKHWDALLSGAARVTGHMAEFIVRAQGLAAHTQMLRDAFGADIQHAYGMIADKSWSDLSGVQKRFFTEYGMGEKDWDILRTKAIDQGMMSPAKLAREGEGAERDTATRFLGAITTTQHVAVPEGNSVTRSLLMAGGARPGTWGGEFVRSFAQYKGFGMSALMSSWARAMEPLAEGEGRWNRAQWIAGLIVGTTVMGALSNQLRDIAAGKDPEPLVGPHAGRFWAQAFAQGGAGGIFGNELRAIMQAQRLDDAGRALSPMAGLGLDLGELALGPIHGEATADLRGGPGKETFAILAAKKARKYTPMVWQFRLAFDRIVHDTLTRMADPDASAAFSRIEERARKQEGTAYWWRPGSTEPRRAPDLGNVSP